MGIPATSLSRSNFDPSIGRLRQSARYPSGNLFKGERRLASSATWYTLVLVTCWFTLGALVSGPVAAKLGVENNQFWTEADPGVPGIEWPNNHFGSSLAKGDFDCDGYVDLAIGSPWADRPGISDSGAVIVLFGSPNGLVSGRAQFWDQKSNGVPDDSETSDYFGRSLASGNFDGANCADLAIGAPGESLGAMQYAGVVHVLYGIPGLGLHANGNQYFHQDSEHFPDQAEAGDFFGSSLAAGNFNGDGYDDLIVGAPLEDLPAGQNAGMITFVQGREGGLAAFTAVGFDQDSPGIPGGAEAEDKFGSDLAAGDFNGDGYEDLAVGVPFEGLTAGEDAGQVTVMYGSQFFYDGPLSEIWHLDSAGVAGSAQAGGLFGFAVTTGDFNHDGYSDLAAGAPGMATGGQVDAGAITALYGGASGISALGNQNIHQDTAGILDLAEAGDRFGAQLDSGDFNSDGYEDLAVGVDLESIGAATQAGAVQALYGSIDGLTITGNQFWHQDIDGILDVSETGDFFGRALAAGDFDGDGGGDLAIGVTNETIDGGIQGAGAVQVLYSSGAGIVLPKTGQTRCFDDDGLEIDCVGTGQDGDTRAGQPWPIPRFETQPIGTIIDRLTGLTWLRDANCMRTHYPEVDTTSVVPGDGAVEWQTVLDFVAGINAGDYPDCGGGFTDWRMPNANELFSLVHLGHSFPADWLTASGFQNVMTNNAYWSSTSHANGAVDVHMGYGFQNFRSKWGTPNGDYAWSVRGTSDGSIYLPKTGQTTCYDRDRQRIECAGTGQDGDLKMGALWPKNRLQTLFCDLTGPCADPSVDCDGDPSSDVVLDRLTGLMWPRDSDIPDALVFEWYAYLVADSLNTGSGLCGFTDWRMPNLRELHSLVDFEHDSPALSLDHPFVNLPPVPQEGRKYWSSTWTEAPVGVPYVWAMDIDWGRTTYYSVPESGSHAWPVRDASILFSDGFESGDTTAWSSTQ